ncbi:sugar dehydrogenase complex small subunit [Castellaniella sp.]|uniref:sugar dehydrogenase complex small subunit n=1 Tax=Castellaniella sp. TaxID=1955812 RepID=UPI0035668065
MDTRRRALLLSTLASPVLARGAGATPTAITPDDFIALCAQLCRQPVTALDRDMAGRILQICLQEGKMAALHTLLAAPDTPSPLASELRSAWYSGLMPGASGLQVVGFQHALAWNSTHFLHVPGICGGPTGYWSRPADA